MSASSYATESATLLDWLTALGTIGAVAIAGWAAWAATQSARVTRQMVKIERDRDEAARVSQAQRVTVDLMTEDIFDETGNRVGADCRLYLVNASTAPLYRTRIKIVAGSAVWGPQLIGSVAPGQEIELYARLMTTADRLDADAPVRFYDPDGQAWIASPGGHPVQAGDDVQTWIDDAAAFSQRELTSFERGMTIGVHTADFDSWREYAESQEPD